MAEFPDRIQRFDLDGTTYEGNKIWGVKVIILTYKKLKNRRTDKAMAKVKL